MHSLHSSYLTVPAVETRELTRLGGEVTVDGVARLLVGEILHGLKGRRTCGREQLITTAAHHIVDAEYLTEN